MDCRVVGTFAQSVPMKALLERIEKRLVTHPSVTVFDVEIERVWPLLAREQTARDARKQAIHEFAAHNGLVATITDPGFRVTFRRASPHG